MAQLTKTSAYHAAIQRRPNFVIISLTLLCLAALGSTLYFGNQLYQEITVKTATSYRIANENANKIAAKIDLELARLQALADRISTDLSIGALKYDQINERMENELKGYKDIFGLSVVFARGVYEPDKLYAPYYKKSLNGEFELIYVEDFYDYTDPDLTAAAWYREAMSGTGSWHDPYFGRASQEWLVNYNVPFYKATQNPEILAEPQDPIGLVSVVHSLETFNQLLKSVDTGEEGFTYLLTNDGKFISHPDPDFIRQSIYDKANELDSEILRNIGDRLSNEKEFDIGGLDPVTERDAWIFHRHLDQAEWSIGVVFDKTIEQDRPNAFVRTLIWVMLSGTLLLILLIVLFLRIDRISDSNLWTISIIVSLLFVTFIVVLWYLSIEYTPRDPTQNVLVNQGTVDQHLAQVNLAFERDALPPPIQIPTGVMLETIGFANSNENVASGYIWQKYPLDLPDDIEKGFLLTDVVDPLAGQVEELYRIEEDGHELIVWFFRATLRQEPSVEKYPLDEATVQIQIWPQSLSPHIVLIPDLSGYEFTIPSKNPGIVDVLVLENWKIDRSYFSYRYDDYNADFGSQNLIRKRNVPDLYFNVIIRRAIISPAVAHAVTMLIVFALAFAVLLVEVDGSFTVLGYGASLFFVVAVSHIGLRDELEIPGVVYLESGYIVLYITILSISLNSILYHSNVKTIVNRFHHNLLPKLLYWPLVTGVFLAISIVFLLPPSVRSESSAAVEPIFRQEGGNIRIGLIAPLSGGSTNGKSTKNAADFAVQEINAAGGLKVAGRTYTLKLLIEDNQTEPSMSVESASRLIAQENVVAIIGPQSSRQAVPTGRFANEQQTPLISPKSTNPATTKDRPWVFRVPYLDPFQGQVMADFVTRELRATRAAILYDVNNNYSTGLALNFRDSFEALGGLIVSFESFETDDSDFGDQLARIQASNPDLIFAPSLVQDTVNIAQQARAIGIDVPLIGGDSWGKSVLLEQCGDACEGLIFSAHYAPDIVSDVAQKFVPAYQEVYEEVPDDTAALTYDAFQLLFHAIQNVNVIEKAAIRDALDRIDRFDGVTGVMSFNEEGDPQKCAVIIQVVDGAFRYFDQACPPNFP